MRKPAQSVARQPNLTSYSLPAPVGGWNARDSIAKMAPTDARFLENCVPLPTDIMLRYGYTNYATGMTGQVETIAHYSGGATDKLFAWAGTSLYDVSAGGAVGAAAVTGLTNARWEFTNTTTAGGNFLLAVNGVDKLQLYDGATWTAIDAVSVPAITGLATTSISNIHLFAHRLWLIEKNTLNAWYLPTDAIAGAAVKFSLGGISREGGYLVAMGSWTIDAGYGVDDLLVFVTNKGEVIVYKGTDPASATTWALVGIWQLGAPVGKRCFMKYAGDLLLISQDGLIPMSSALQSSRLNPKVSLTDKIQYAASSAIAIYGATFGWETLYYAKANLLFLNVPVAVGQQQQYVMNTITKAWCNFTGWNANCWELFQDEPYFGGDGVVCRAWNGLSDNGSQINGSAAQAYNYFGAQGQQKQFKMARPIISASGPPSVKSGIDVNFEESILADLSTSASSSAAWDSAIWDSSTWGGSMSIYRGWQGLYGIGFAGSYRIQMASRGIEHHWIATDITFERGGLL